jgi:hypothetical protein
VAVVSAAEALAEVAGDDDAAGSLSEPPFAAEATTPNARTAAGMMTRFFFNHCLLGG